jgi:lysophospholipase L1-like esterase
VAAADRCQAPASLVHFTAPLPRFTEAVQSARPVRIVALGSSSTKGVGASSPKACYPAKLEAELRKRFPGRTIVVDNLGIGGQLATDMLKRITSQVLPSRPDLVIWQTGVNDAVMQVDLGIFHATVRGGVDLLRKAGIDVVLLDMQYFPGAEKIPNFASYLVAMREIAGEQRVPLLQRYAIMKHFVMSARYAPQDLLAPDLFHPNDFSYACLGNVLADALQDEVTRTPDAKRPVAPTRQAGDPVVPVVH